MSRSRPRIGVVLLAATILITIGIHISASKADKPPIEIAVIGPMTGKDAPSGQAMIDGVRLQVARVNRLGGIHGRQVRVKAYDNRHDADLARQEAQRIVGSERAHAVIGHYYSSLSLEGGEVYEANGIPAVTGSATAPDVTCRNPWYFRVISGNNLQGKLSALYMAEILEQEEVHIVYEKDAYGRTLKRAFSSAAAELDIKVGHVWGIDSLNDDVSARLTDITRTLSAADRPGALYVGLLDGEAAQLVLKLHKAGVDLPILGGDALGLGSFPQEIRKLAGADAPPGTYTDGVYVTTYFIRDIANHRAQQFSRAFQREYGRAPDALAAAYYDAAGIVLAAIRRAGPGGTLIDRRERIRRALSSFDAKQSAYRGVTGGIYFDDQGNAINPSPFGVYVGNAFVSAPVQLTPVLTPESVLNPETQIAQGDLVAFDDNLFYKTRVIYTGVDINEISNIDQKEERFTADFYLWFRHTLELDYDKIELSNTPVTLEADSETILRSVVDDMFYRAFRVKATIHQPFKFHHYPFDVQALEIRFRHKHLSRNELIFVADDIGMRRHQGTHLADRLRRHKGFKGEDKWRLRDILVYSDIRSTDSTLGNPRMFDAGLDTGITYSGFNVVSLIERNAKSYAVKNMVPLIFILLLGYAMTFILPEGALFAARLNLGVILLLTSVSLSLMTANQLPNIGYLVAMDYIYFFLYLWLLMGIMVTIAVRGAYYLDKPRLQRRLEWSVRLTQPLLLVIMLGIILNLYF